jgi:putative transposase
MNRKFEFIAAKKGHCALIELHRAVGVSKSTWHRHQRAASRWSQERAADQELRGLIRKIWDESGQAYGAPRVSLELRDLGWVVNHKKVARLMQEEGIFSCVPHRPPGTKPRPKAADVDDLVHRRFEAKRPNQIWACDITQIRTGHGWLYLVCFVDLYSRRVVGYAMGRRCTAKLVVQAFMAAIKDRQPPAGLIIHTDRGPQFVSRKFQNAVRDAKCRLSMARPGHGHCADNAVAESLWASLKKERINRWRWANRTSCTKVIHNYIAWYNQSRRHSYLGGVAPATFELAIAA